MQLPNSRLPIDPARPAATGANLAGGTPSAGSPARETGAPEFDALFNSLVPGATDAKGKAADVTPAGNETTHNAHPAFPPQARGLAVGLQSRLAGDCVPGASAPDSEFDLLVDTESTSEVVEGANTEFSPAPIEAQAIVSSMPIADAITPFAMPQLAVPIPAVESQCDLPDAAEGLSDHSEDQKHEFGPGGSTLRAGLGNEPEWNAAPGIGFVARLAPSASYPSSGDAAVAARPERNGVNTEGLARAIWEPHPSPAGGPGVLGIGPRSAAKRDGGGEAASPRAAKIAPDLWTPPAGEDRHHALNIKSFVASDKQRLAEDAAGVGTGVANPDSIMSFRSNLPHTHPAFEYVGAAATPVQGAVVESSFEPAAVSSAHAAVEVVLQAVHHVASREQNSVKLNLAVGEHEVAVRVELHGEEVRTTFHTESAEVRAALTREWQSVVAQTPDRSLRLAPAVFTGGEGGSTSADTSAHQQGRHAQNFAADATALAGLAARARSSLNNADTSPVPGTPVTATPQGTARRLLSFA